MQKLNPENQILITRDTISQILSAYSISDFTFKPINEGIANMSFVIESGNNKYVLRIYAQDRKSDEDIAFEIKFQDYLREHEIPIPLISKNSHDQELSVVEIDGKKWQCILMEFVEGNSVTAHPSRELITHLATLQAHIHVLGIEFAENTGIPKKSWLDLHDGLAEKLETIPVQTKEVLEFINMNLKPKLG